MCTEKRVTAHAATLNKLDKGDGCQLRNVWVAKDINSDISWDSQAVRLVELHNGDVVQCSTQYRLHRI